MLWAMRCTPVPPCGLPIRCPFPPFASLFCLKIRDPVKPQPTAPETMLERPGAGWKAERRE